LRTPTASSSSFEGSISDPANPTSRSDADHGVVKPALSLVILCYRSEDYARDFLANALAMFERYEIRDYEVVLVGCYVEGKQDRTPEIVRELAAGDPRIRCCAEPKQGWMGWDLRFGLRAARGDHIAFIDGDGQMPIDDVGRLYELIQTGSYDLVKTHRVVRQDGWKRKVMSTVYNLMFRVLFPGLRAHDMNSKPKILTREAYEKMDLRSDGWFIDAEMMIEARHHRLRIGELPTEFHALRQRASFVSLATSFEFVWGLLRARVREFFR